MTNCELCMLHAMKWKVLASEELEEKEALVTCF